MTAVIHVNNKAHLIVFDKINFCDHVKNHNIPSTKNCVKCAVFLTIQDTSSICMLIPNCWIVLYKKVEKIAPEVIGKVRRMYKGVSANVDFYSGFVYSMLNIPSELYTPIFAIARIAGWSAHRIEEIVNMGKIIRPAYKSVAKRREYIPIDQR